jgi:endonuclease I
MNFRFFQYCIILFLLPVAVLGQGTYYNSIDTGSVSFVTSLHNLINPHTKISYAQFDETNVVFVSRDTLTTKKVVTCVYSGENYVYTPPFAWTTFSREHTYCHSWMPTNPADSPERPEYSDQHHLFPTNQNNANGVRSNHPLGIVTTVTSSYLESKYGKNSSNQNVFEPRNSHKGDAARALLYMAVCYNGVDGYDWTFNHLNTVILPPQNEAPQSVDLLIQWHNQDPPDQWEMDRNEYIYSIQGNRNPFIDHPEYVAKIDFNTLTKRTWGSTLASEPTNYQRGFGYFDPTITDTSITVKWQDTTGAVLPTGYILFANTSGTFGDPVDGTVYSDDTNLSDGSAAVNIAYSAADTFRFGGLTSATSYYFKIFPYNGSGSTRNYKTANFPSFTSYIMYTTNGSGTPLTSVVVNEYQNGSDQTTEWVELLVQQNNLDMRGMKLRDYSAAGSTQAGLVFSNDNLWASVPQGSFIVVLASSNAQTQDLSFSGDKKVIVSATNSTYFSGTSFNIGATNDAVEILTSGTTHIHSLSHGSKPGNIATLGAPTANITGGSTSGNVVRFINVSAGSHFGEDAHTQHSSTATQGAANDAAQTTYVTSVLPVELVFFTGSVNRGMVTLRWETATEVNNHGFEVERKAIDNGKLTVENWKRLGFVEGNGTTNIVHEYSYTDRTVSAGTYAYRLKQIDRDGKFEYSSEIVVTMTSVPQHSSLMQNYPNPFNPTTTIRFTLAAPEYVILTVHNALGQTVSTAAEGMMNTGAHEVLFDAATLASGTYFYSLTAGKFRATKSFVLMR